MIRCERSGPEYQVRFSNGTFEAVCDATPDKGGLGQGFRPHELLEAALGSCTTMVIAMAAKTHDISLSHFAVSVDLDRSDPDVAAFVCTVTFPAKLPEADKDYLLRAARTCPVRKTLGRHIEFREQTD